MSEIKNEKLEQCVLDLHKIGVLKFGDFTLKSGMQSPVYFDLRIVVSYPKLLETVAELCWDARVNSEYDHICGVPYTALPIASVLSVKKNIPMLIRRKESKGYGTKKMVEGIFKENEKCLVIEDVIVSGTSVFENIQSLRDLQLVANDAVVFLDREQGGRDNLLKKSVNVVSVVTMSQMLSVLRKHGRISEEVSESVLDFIHKNDGTSIITNGTSTISVGEKSLKRISMPFESRQKLTNQSCTKKLFSIMSQKQTNLCIAADVTTSAALLDLADRLGPHICLLKTHVDILADFSEGVAEQLKQIAAKYNFLIMEDRKFADIGNTVQAQYSNGIYKIVEWADIVTVHGLPGDGVVKGLASCLKAKERGCVLITEMSSENSYSSKSYMELNLKIAEENEYFVCGFVCQKSPSDNPRHICMTPGVRIGPDTSDSLGQKYISPEYAVMNLGADIIIVGRGITQAEDLQAAAATYKKAGYEAYKTRVELV